MTADITRRQALVGVGAAVFGLWAGPSWADAVRRGGDLVPVTPVPETELRGLSLAGTDTVWISGRGGMVLRGVRGLGLRPHPVAGAEALDFRDIHGHCPLRAVAMSAGPGEASTLWRTQTGGRTWEKVFVNPDPEGFFDAIAFWSEQDGVVFGDPVGGRFALFRTRDGGQTWARHDPGIMPEVLPGEAAFAASGTCMAAGPEGRVAFVTGGDMAQSGGQARVFVSGPGGRDFRVVRVPVPADRPSRGLFSVAWADANTLMAVGGDYADPAFEAVNAVISRDGGQSFLPFETGVRGYLSCVAVAQGQVMVTGLGGTVVNGQRLSDAPPMNSCALWPDGRGWLVGPKGRVLKLNN
ncbi:MAG: photosystem II stability/assembly factor-like protein [Asticcacaulis sp.]